MDAICIATPAPLHAAQAIKALRAGKHVLSEVPAAYTLEEAFELVRTVEETGKIYMLAENYCFMRDVLMVQNMVDQGVFGELIYARGNYIHDIRSMLFTDDGDLTWRGKMRQTYAGNTYPTHSLGPVLRWLGINRHDSLATTASWHSRTVAAARYARQHRPNRPEHGGEAAWKTPDTVTSMIRTASGALVESRIDWVSPCPHNMVQYELQGTKAAFSSPLDPKQESMIWIEGRSPIATDGSPEAWEPIFKYAEEFEHPLWRDHGREAVRAGHRGGDYFVLREFLSAIEEGRRPLCDVYDAVTWSSIIPLSAASIASGNNAVDVPDFCTNRG